MLCLLCSSVFMSKAYKTVNPVTLHVWYSHLELDFRCDQVLYTETCMQKSRLRRSSATPISHHIKTSQQQPMPHTISSAVTLLTQIEVFPMILLRSEIPSGICSKLRTVAASNNRVHMP